MLTTDVILEEEERILALVQRWVDEEQPDNERLPTADGLSAVQCHAAAAVAGGRRLALVVGPAGTGKTTAMRPAVVHLQEQGRACFAVAPSAAAAEVLAVESGIDADTLDKLLIEHRLHRPPQHRYDLPTGTTVIVDEAAMVPTPRLAELIHLADRRGWRLALVGDPMQFSAVGRSGMFGHLVDTLGAVELDRVHRFGAPWEREASLRLRRGDTDVVDLYDQHGRFHGGTRRQMAMATVSAWWIATEAGETAAMMAPTREAVAVLNLLAQAMRADAGEIDRQSTSVRLGASRAYVGDIVATRRNDRTLRTDRDRMIKNRDRWTVETVLRDGAITATGASGRITLPAPYVAADVELAYAETSHATQGRTVDRSYLYLDGPTDTRGIYVPLTRGRTTNEAFVVLQDERTAAEVVADAVARTWVDQPATALRLDRPVPAPGRPTSSGREPTPTTGRPPSQPVPAAVRAPISEPDLRALVSTAVANRIEVARLQYELDDQDRTIADLTRRRLDTEQAIAQAKTRLVESTHMLEEHGRPFRRRGHRPEIAQAKADARSLPHQISELEAEHVRLAREIAAERAAMDRTEHRGSGPAREPARRVVAAIDVDARSRGELAADRPSPLLVAHLGPIPEDPAARDRWITAAGRIEQHRALW